MELFRRVSWGAVACLLFMVMAQVAVAVGEDTLAIVWGLCSISWALLSLKEVPT